MTLTYGIDVSHWTGQINYAEIMTSGYGKDKRIPVFNFIKASEGKSFKDNLYAYHISESRKVGLLTGAYHYYREGVSPSAQGKLFAQIYNDNGGTDLPPVIDVEKINNSKLVGKNVADCINEIIEHTGRQPIIYTGFYIWRDMMKSASWGKNYKLWLADYTEPVNVPYPWTDWTFWQFSDKYGDENWYNGSVDDLRKEFGLTASAPVISPVVEPSFAHWYDDPKYKTNIDKLVELHNL